MKFDASIVTRFLTWARVVDPHDGRVSLTSVALGVTLSAATAAPGPWTAIALGIAVAAYAHKRHVNAAEAARDARLVEAARVLADVSARLADSEKSILELKHGAAREGNRRAIGPTR